MQSAKISQRDFVHYTPIHEERENVGNREPTKEREQLARLDEIEACSHLICWWSRDELVSLFCLTLQRLFKSGDRNFFSLPVVKFQNAFLVIFQKKITQFNFRKFTRKVFLEIS